MSDLQQLWGKLSAATSCKSLLKKHLTPQVYEKLKNKRTKLGGTLADCIRSGCKNLDSGVGLYACDEEAYTVFSDLFDAVIKDYHKVDKVAHPEPGQFGDVKSVGDLDPEGKFVVSTRVRVGRSHEGFPFPPTCTLDQRKKMEQTSKDALETLEGDLKGQYFSLETMSKEDEDKLIADHFLFKNDDRFLSDAGGYGDWPKARGIFFSNDKKFLTWVNEEDHLRFISMQMGGNLGEVYQRLVKAIEHMTKTMKFAKNKNLGYLTFCPTNLGTTMRASVHVKVPLLAASGELNAVCAKHNLQPRGIHGEHTESVGGVYDISNKRRLGLTEFEALKEMENGVKEVIKIEKELQAKK